MLKLRSRETRIRRFIFDYYLGESKIYSYLLVCKIFPIAYAAKKPPYYLWRHGGITYELAIRSLRVKIRLFALRYIFLLFMNIIARNTKIKPLAIDKKIIQQLKANFFFC